MDLWQTPARFAQLLVKKRKEDQSFAKAEKNKRKKGGGRINLSISLNPIPF